LPKSPRRMFDMFETLLNGSLKGGVYTVPQAQKSALLLDELNDLTSRHAVGCDAYAAILAARSSQSGSVSPIPAQRIEDVPFLPVRLFKTHLLQSVPNEAVLKVLTSSGTTGQAVSRIVLDAETSQLQTKVMVAIMQSFLGTARSPMLIIDHPGVVKNRQTFSARGAGILGMANFGRAHTYVLRDTDMGLDFEALDKLLDRAAGGPVLLFGFTFMVWKHLISSLRAAGRKIEIPNGVLVHSGGWKKLEEEAVDNATFKAALAEWTGIRRVHNFYGMVEQVGSIFVECEAGRLHAPIYSDVIVRDPMDWSALPIGAEGLIQVVSALPRSYPGHSLLTEDRGMLTGEDNCPCGRKGRTFSVLGRLPKAELRGCSDTYAQSTLEHAA
jgi:hypothetical protein